MRISAQARNVITVVLGAFLILIPTATVANAATHWHRTLQPVHYDRNGVWLGSLFPINVDFQGTTQHKDGVHTDIVKYKEWVTGANDYHYLRHAN